MMFPFGIDKRFVIATIKRHGKGTVFRTCINILPGKTKSILKSNLNYNLNQKFIPKI